MCSLGVENISFKCGRAEDVLPSLIKSVEHEDPMAIVDPPRAGLSEWFINFLQIVDFCYQ